MIVNGRFVRVNQILSPRVGVIRRGKEVNRFSYSLSIYLVIEAIIDAHPFKPSGSEVMLQFSAHLSESEPY